MQNQRVRDWLQVWPCCPLQICTICVCQALKELNGQLFPSETHGCVVMIYRVLQPGWGPLIWLHPPGEDKGVWPGSREARLAWPDSLFQACKGHDIHMIVKQLLKFENISSSQLSTLVFSLTRGFSLVRVSITVLTYTVFVIWHYDEMLYDGSYWLNSFLRGSWASFWSGTHGLLIAKDGCPWPFAHDWESLLRFKMNPIPSCLGNNEGDLGLQQEQTLLMGRISRGKKQTDMKLRMLKSNPIWMLIENCILKGGSVVSA